MIPELDINALPAVGLSERHNLPDIVAVYFVLSPSGAMLYVGATASLRRRWYSTSHHRLRQLPSRARIAWIETKPSQLARRESIWIRHFRPKFNRTRVLLTNSKTTMIAIRAPNAQATQLERLAKKEGRSLSNYLTRALDDHLKRVARKAKRAANGK